MLQNIREYYCEVSLDGIERYPVRVYSFTREMSSEGVAVLASFKGQKH